jgi:pimeloyl-ACP methyl ester carboxylesterase
MNSRDLSWPLEETTIDGTLVLPDGPGPFPGVVLVAGSGPTDRDWNSPFIPGTTGSARLLAEALASAGFASLRYDKRLTGPRAKDNVQALMGRLSMRTHLDELVSAVEALVREAPVRRDRLFIIGNSEGTLHALNYQASAPAIPAAGLVLIAPPGRPVGAVARTQIGAQLAALPNAAELVRYYDEAMARFAAGQPAVPNPALPPAAQQLFQGLEYPVNLPFARELWLADGAALLPTVPGPVLVMIGKKDLQVDWQLDGGPLEQAARGRTDVTFLYPEHANHVIKHEATPRETLRMPDALARYGEGHLDGEAVTAILGWLAARLDR